MKRSVIGSLWRVPDGGAGDGGRRTREPGDGGARVPRVPDRFDIHGLISPTLER